MNMVSDVMENENLQSEIFASDASLLSFFSGIWIQFCWLKLPDAEGKVAGTGAENI